MQQLTLILILSSLLINTFFVLQAETFSDSFLGSRGVTTFHFYLQVFSGGNKQSGWRVAKSNLSDILPSEFGVVYVFDHRITTGPETNSGEIGRMQGIIAFSDFHEKSLVVLIIVVCTDGEYKGSTLNIVGRDPLMNKFREASILGGTGAFRMASGYVISRTYSIDDDKMREVYEYNATVFHMG